jgi:type I restriction enzyme S subunit
MEVRQGYKQTEVGLIPEDWQVRRLDEITEQQRPISYGIVQTGANLSNGVPCLRVVDINNGVIKKTDLIRTSRLISDSYRRTILKAGDLVMPLRGKVGDVGIVDAELEGSNLTRGVALIAIPNAFSASYCRQFISWPATRKRLEQAMNGSALQEIPIATLRSFTIALPPSETEQRGIATALSDVDALLDGLTRLITKKRDLKQASIQQLLTGQTRLPGFSGAWEVKTLADVVERFIGGGTPSRANPEFWGGEIPWVTVKDFATFDPFQAQESITKLGLLNSAANLIPAGTLITSTRMALGKAVAYKVDVAINQDLKALIVKQQVTVNFLLHWFTQNGEHIDALGGGSTVKGISVGELKRLPILLPDITEQTAIATVLSDMDTELAALEARLTKTRALKQAMISELLTGKTRLPT